MRSNGHDDVAQGEGGPGREPQGTTPTRHFEDRDGTQWVVTWRPSTDGQPGEPHGVYVFARSTEGGEEYRLAATSPAGGRLSRMPVADVRQMLALARANVLED